MLDQVLNGNSFEKLFILIMTSTFF